MRLAVVNKKRCAARSGDEMTEQVAQACEQGMGWPVAVTAVALFLMVAVCAYSMCKVVK
jgi:hypothetical protein